MTSNDKLVPHLYSGRLSVVRRARAHCCAKPDDVLTLTRLLRDDAVRRAPRGAIKASCFPAPNKPLAKRPTNAPRKWS
uniref:Uncharacterized protein n=1 Tax=Mycena chlorophos TaxID=658473 RepID=A0ABQ0LMA6_MYCCL|nr:predicted protein [Mycena chlorophos]